MSEGQAFYRAPLEDACCDVEGCSGDPSALLIVEINSQLHHTFVCIDHDPGVRALSQKVYEVDGIENPSLS